MNIIEASDQVDCNIASPSPIIKLLYRDFVPYTIQRLHMTDITAIPLPGYNNNEKIMI